MKKTVIILMSIFALIACNSSKNDNSKNDGTQTKTETINTVGGEKDEHGCLTAAGETWSQLKQDCIKIFEIGQRLNPVEIVQGEAVISAFVLYSDDKSEVELFMPKIGDSHILKASDNETYESGDYKFDSKDGSLYINGEKAYQSNDLK